MERVSDEWLDEQISLYDHLGDEISDLGKERCAALVELRDRRAADDPEDAEYASYEASKAQAEQLAAMTAGQLERLGSGVMFELMRRAAEREQAEPPLLDKDITNLTCYYERYIMDNWTDTPDERCRMADATIHALIELQSLRAAGREQAAQAVPAKPTWEEAVKRRDAEREQAADGRERWQDQPMVEITADSSMLDKQIAMLQAKKIMGFSDQPWATTCAPKAEQAAPEPRKPAKWERQMQRMGEGASLVWVDDEDKWQVWVESNDEAGRAIQAWGDTPKAAVEAAWKAWKEERGE